MTISSKTEQALTHRPNSYVPGKTLSQLFNLDFQASPDGINHAMHVSSSQTYTGVTRAYGSGYLDIVLGC
jgi:hypothetical protein